MNGTDLIDKWMDSPGRLSRLTDKQLSVLLLEWIGYSQQEMGTILGVSQQAVCKRLQRARERLEA